MKTVNGAKPKALSFFALYIYIQIRRVQLVKFTRFISCKRNRISKSHSHTQSCSCFDYSFRNYFIQRITITFTLPVAFNQFNGLSSFRQRYYDLWDCYIMTGNSTVQVSMLYICLQYAFHTIYAFHMSSICCNMLFVASGIFVLP